MPLLTTVIDDKSPLISYDATWLAGTSLDDNLAINYYLGTFQKNNAPDGTASVSVNASAFWIYGANRQNHGTYTIQVDSASYPNFNGSGNNLFQQSLFAMNVSQDMHTVKLTNTGGTSGLYVDIDMIVWQSEVGNASDELVPQLVQDVDPRFRYDVPVWSTTSSVLNLNLNLFSNGTGHLTDTSGAAASFTFTGMLVVPHRHGTKLTALTGEAVTIFGTSGPSNGPYSVQLDGGSAVQYNATNAYPTSYGVTIYHADNLGPGVHQVVLTNLPAAPGQYLSVDYAQLWTIANSSTSASPVSPSAVPCVPSSSNNTLQNKLSSGAIAGLVVEGVVAVLAAVVAAVFYRRWRAALADSQASYTPFPRSLATTTATTTGIAPSLLEARSNLSSPQSNVIRPLAANGSTAQDNVYSHGPSRSLDSRIVAEAMNPSHKAPNEDHSLVRRAPPVAPGGGLTGLSGGHDQVLAPDRAGELPPPGYDM